MNRHDAAERPPTRVVLGVAGGIAAYKAAHLLRLLTESGHDVQVVPTASALKFVGEATWTALSGHPLATDVWADAHRVPHVTIGRNADLVVVAPATADLLAKAAHGLADDLLTNVLLTATCPVVMAPAMHTEMWEHPATQQNVATLRERGVIVLEPATGRLTGEDSGKGRLPEPEAIAAAAAAALAGGRPDDQDLDGLHVVVSAGGTREHLDPVRFLGNRSSGRQGHALAAAALARGARVTLVAANTSVPPPAGATVVSVVSAQELREAMHAATTDADIVVMAAAVADFRPARMLPSKLKKSDDPSQTPAPVVLERTPDVLAELVRTRAGNKRPVIVGFAAETGDEVGTVLEHAANKLRRKGCDLLVVNDVGPGGAFESPSNEVWILAAGRAERHIPRADKLVVAHAVLDAAVDEFA
jgi:phosphopantothenoylcysteine decarboxylase/phosphopantothenate--cysteine ligase